MKLNELLPYLKNENIYVFFDNKTETRLGRLYYEGCAENLGVPDNFIIVNIKAHKEYIYILITWED